MSFRSFANRDPNQDTYDVIIVGSGPSGLACASTLGRFSDKKLKILVLEAHDETPGGCMHSFNCGGITFCSGIHYLAASSKSSAAIWTELTGGQKWTEDKVNVIDTLYIDGKPTTYTPLDWEQKFGLSKKAVARVASNFMWIALVKLLWYPLAVIAWFYFTHFGGRREAEMDWAEWCRKESGQKEVNPIWFTESGDWGSVHKAQKPGQSCAMCAGAVYRYYNSGVMYVDGGYTETVRRMCSVAKERGATILIDAKVDEITFDDKTGAATGVTVKGVAFKAPKIVVSGAHALMKLTGKRCPKNIVSAVNALGESPKHGVVFLAYKGKTAKDLGLTTGPKWILDTKRKARGGLQQGGEGSSGQQQQQQEETFGFFVSHKEQDAGTGVYIIWEMPYIPRGADYIEKKEELAEEAKKYVFALFPALADYSDEDAATPATTEHYVQGHLGASYGLDTPTKRFFDWDIVRALRPETDLPGVFLTGQDILMLGVSGAMTNGILTAQVMLTPSVIDIVFRGKNFLKIIENEYRQKLVKEGGEKKKYETNEKRG